MIGSRLKKCAFTKCDAVGRLMERWWRLRRLKPVPFINSSLFGISQPVKNQSRCGSDNSWQYQLV